MSSPTSFPFLTFEALSEKLASQVGLGAPERVPLAQALGRISAGVTRAPRALPATATAQLSGYAVAALDLAGASSLSPVYLPSPPAFVEAGSALPPGADAILPPHLFEETGPFASAFGEVFPGEGIWRAGDWVTEGELIAPLGAPLTALHCALAQDLGLEEIAVLAPVVQLIGSGPSRDLLHYWLSAQGVKLLSSAEPEPSANLIIFIGTPLSARASSPCGVGFAGLNGLIAANYSGKPLLALPNVLPQVMLAAVALVQPLLNRLLARPASPTASRPLLRKVTSPVGQAELLLLAQSPDGWQVLNTDAPSPTQFLRADAFHIIASGTEGYPQGTPLEATLCKGWSPL